MKTKIITFLLLVATINSYSQVDYFNYFDYTSEWRTFSGGFDGCCGTVENYRTTYFDGDEVIDGITYYKVYTSRIYKHFDLSGNLDETNTYLNGPSYYREDESGKFYHIDSNGNEVISFDNQLIIDAEIGSEFPETSNECYIQTIETLYLGARGLKRIKGSNTLDIAGSLEGIGYIGSSCGTGVEGSTFLCCYTKEGDTLRFGTIDCDLFPIPERNGLSTEGFSSNKVTIYPNPVQNSLHITAQKPITAIEIHTLLGQQLLSTTSNALNEAIDLSRFNSGMYLVTVKLGAHTKTYKVLKD